MLKARFTRHRYDLHTHPTYVIALITDGCERVRIGHQTVVAPSGTVLIVDPEVWHDGEAGADEGWAYRTFYPSVPLMSRIAAELGQDRPPLFSQAIIGDSDLVQALALAHRDSTSGDATSGETSMLVALRKLILRYGDWGGRPEMVEGLGSRSRLSIYEQVIEDSLTAELDLQRLARAAGVTRFQVIRDFKKVVGLTPAAFIRDRKLRRANLLIQQGSSLADAASAAGFSDQSHLSRIFRAAHGMTPGMFRRAG
ncbi:AraC family transcriptional regulator [Mesorhizobium sp. AR10]|nr:AraC family transcriptional regulator [Mesorhizobium sp. AR10]